jgi:hypothetical protein
VFPSWTSLHVRRVLDLNTCFYTRCQTRPKIASCFTRPQPTKAPRGPNPPLTHHNFLLLPAAYVQLAMHKSRKHAAFPSFVWFGCGLCAPRGDAVSAAQGRCPITCRPPHPSRSNSSTARRHGTPAPIGDGSFRCTSRPEFPTYGTRAAVQLEHRSVSSGGQVTAGRRRNRCLMRRAVRVCARADCRGGRERRGVGCGGWRGRGRAGWLGCLQLAVPDLEVDQTSAAGNGTACASVRPLPNTHPCMSTSRRRRADRARKTAFTFLFINRLYL